jgi:hypothetical protein
MQHLDLMEQPVQNRRREDLIVRKSRTCLFDVSTMLPRS